MEIIVGIIIGVALGLAAGWLAGRAGSATVRAELAATRSTTERLVSAERESARERLAQQERSHQDRLIATETALRQQIAAERTNALDRLNELREDRKRLADEFEALSAKVLDQSTRTFLDRADERFKRSQQLADSELAKREVAVQKLVEPLQLTLAEVKNEVTSAEKSRLEANAALTEQLHAMRTSSDSLRTETSQLVTALRAPQVRGRWGELQLRRVVEAAGMVSHIDFDEQVSKDTDDGRLRPDMVVHLPGDKDIVVDAKVAFNGYLEAMDARDEAERNRRLDAHARHVRSHIDALGAKAYWEQFEATPEFVVMFLPAETFLYAAMERDPGILEHSFSKNVVIATPATLVALLRTVAYTWRQENLTTEAQQVLTVGRELHKRLGTLGGHLAVLAKRLNGTVEAFNKFNSSLDSQVVTQARRFSALQGVEPTFDAPPPLEVLAVPAQKPDVYLDDEAAALTEPPNR